jgi:ATP-dependent RNA helicase RhlE
MNPTRRNSSSRGRSSYGPKKKFSNSPSRGGKFTSGRSRSTSSASKSGSRGKPTRFSRGGRPSGRPSGGRGGKKNAFNPSQFINTNPVEITEEVYTPKHSFNAFGLNPKLVETVHKMGITSPTPIQDQIIPEILKGRDVIGIAETGTGKTAAFLLPLIEKNIANMNRQTLILAPTRELALQIGDELRKLSNGFRIFKAVCVGGMNIGPQIKMLRYKNQFIIGTPGRVMDLMKRKFIKPDCINVIVLDEADRMLDMGFINDMRTILSQIPKEKETLFFSATMPAEARRMVHDFLRDPIEISVKKKDVTNSIEQNVIQYKNEDKFETLLKKLHEPEYKRVLIFGAMKYGVERLSKRLSQGGIKADSIHGNKNHTQRQRALDRFKKGEIQTLIATDVAARGIHVDDVTHVINYDLPNSFEDYVHRIGRTGRGVKRGKALTFVSA